MGTKPLEFTQYLLPNGRAQSIEIDIDESLWDKAQTLIADGAHFDAEVLTTGAVSLTCEIDDWDEPCLAIQVIPNGPSVPVAVGDLIREAYKVAKEPPIRPLLILAALLVVAGAPWRDVG